MFIGFHSGVTSQSGGESVPDGGERAPHDVISHPLFVNLIPNIREAVNNTNVLTNGQYLYRIDGAQVIAASGKT